MPITTFFYDSEFTGLHQSTTLISLALVSENGESFYAEFTDYDHSQCDDWIKENVLTHTRWLSQPVYTANLWREGTLTLCLGDRKQVTKALAEWLASYEQIEIWADCLAYDWVLFCELFGGALKLPPNIFYMPNDLATLFKIKGYDPDCDREAFAETDPKQKIQKHNALWDAQVAKTCYQRLFQA